MLFPAGGGGGCCQSCGELWPVVIVMHTKLRMNEARVSLRECRLLRAPSCSRNTTLFLADAFVVFMQCCTHAFLSPFVLQTFNSLFLGTAHFSPSICPFNRLERVFFTFPRQFFSACISHFFKGELQILPSKLQGKNPKKSIFPRR